MDQFLKDLIKRL